MSGRARAFGVGGAPSQSETAISLAYNERCDMVAATVLLQRGPPASIEPAVLAFLPLYARTLGIENIGLFYVVAGATNIVIRPLLGKKSDSLGRGPAIAAGFAALLIGLTLLVGGYAQRFYLKDFEKRSVSETVLAFRDYLPDFFPLPHPSWRNKAWVKCNPWFETDVIPALRRRVKRLLTSTIRAP